MLYKSSARDRETQIPVCQIGNKITFKDKFSFHQNAWRQKNPDIFDPFFRAQAVILLGTGIFKLLQCSRLTARLLSMKIVIQSMEIEIKALQHNYIVCSTS